MIDSLPRDFDFYHLGRIELSDEPASLPEPRKTAFDLISDDRIAVAYSFNGDAQGAFVLVLDDGLDVSIYSECGNIIASRLATALALREGGEVTVSPPHILSPDGLRKLLEGGNASARTYLHQTRDRTIHLTALVLPQSAIVPTERTGNA